MKRRDFIKAITGFVAGVCMAFVPKVYPKRSGTKFIAEIPSSDLTLEKLQHCADELEKAEIDPNSEWAKSLDHGKWRHIVITDDNSDKSMAIYLDGNRIC